jgi:hypothetical protein
VGEGESDRGRDSAGTEADQSPGDERRPALSGMSRETIRRTSPTFDAGAASSPARLAGHRAPRRPERSLVVDPAKNSLMKFLSNFVPTRLMTPRPKR